VERRREVRVKMKFMQVTCVKNLAAGKGGQRQFAGNLGASGRSLGKNGVVAASLNDVVWR
jgi:hypothetical protein